jgi:hypothetical protein
VLDFPTSIELMTDISAAGWVEEALRWWPSGSGFTVRDFVPDGFEAYARILHPASRAAGDRGTKRWAELAAERGRTMHPLVRFEALVGARGPEEAADWDELVPSEELPEREAAILSDVLADFTASADRCWFALWDGYGSLGPPNGYSTLVDEDGRLRIVDDTRAEARSFAEELSRYPRVGTLRSRSEPTQPRREYLLFRGPLGAILSFRFSDWWQPPNIWWPDDRAWCVATEVDGYDTFVGGSRACIEAVLSSPVLEALATEPDAEFGLIDPLNPAPWDP